MIPDLCWGINSVAQPTDCACKSIQSDVVSAGASKLALMYVSGRSAIKDRMCDRHDCTHKGMQLFRCAICLGHHTYANPVFTALVWCRPPGSGASLPIINGGRACQPVSESKFVRTLGYGHVHIWAHPPIPGTTACPSAGLGYVGPTIIDEDLGMVGSISGPIRLYRV
jgi:hypothetical protein